MPKMEMITILYIYKNKDLTRVRNSLLSLQSQTLQAFEVLFVDYGSQSIYSKALIELLQKFPNVQYHYVFVENQPWSRSKAINVGLKMITTPYVFVADIDMIFRADFIEKLQALSQVNRSVYFKVGFVNKNNSNFSVPFETIPIAFSSEIGAQGLSLFSTRELKFINGFDEFYHFWGAEDIDVHTRLQNAGVEVTFYESEILMLHQWHPSYRSGERKELTSDLQLSGVVQMNHEHLKLAIDEKKTKVNANHWGYSVTQQEYDLLQKPSLRVHIGNTKAEIDHFLCFRFRQKTMIVTEYVFYLNANYGSMKQKIKKSIRKKVPDYYTLKEINDMVLLHLISRPELKNYSYQVAPDLKSITLIF